MIYSGMESFYLGYYPLYMTKISLMLSVKVFLLDNLTHLCNKHTEEVSVQFFRHQCTRSASFNLSFNYLKITTHRKQQSYFLT